MNTLARGAERRAHELPPVLTSSEIDSVLAGDLVPLRTGVSRPTRSGPGGHSSPPDADADPVFSPQATSSAQLPDPRVWVSRFGIAMLECLEGLRPPMQLSRHVHPDVLGRLNRRYRTALRRGKRPGPTLIKRVRVCQPRDGVAEAAIVARLGGRPCPIAVRLCGVDGRWVVTVLEMI